MLREIGKELSVVFVLQLPEPVSVARLTKRAELEGRVDDTSEAIGKRLELYRRETEPLIEWYRVRSNVVTVHADRTPNEVFGELQEALEQAAVA
jgi:adenylate kinase